MSTLFLISSLIVSICIDATARNAIIQHRLVVHALASVRKTKEPAGIRKIYGTYIFCRARQFYKSCFEVSTSTMSNNLMNPKITSDVRACDLNTRLRLSIERAKTTDEETRI